MSTKTVVYKRLMEEGATEITPIMRQPEPKNIDNLKYNVARVMATWKITPYKMGKKLDFLVFIIGKNCYRVKIGDNTWKFVYTDKPGPHEKTSSWM